MGNGYGVDFLNVSVGEATTGTDIWAASSGHRNCHKLMVNIDQLDGGFLKIGGGASGVDPLWFCATVSGIYPFEYNGAGLVGGASGQVSYAASGTVVANIEIGTCYQTGKITV